MLHKSTILDRFEHETRYVVYGLPEEEWAGAEPEVVVSDGFVMLRLPIFHDLFDSRSKFPKLPAQGEQYAYLRADAGVEVTEDSYFNLARNWSACTNAPSFLRVRPSRFIAEDVLSRPKLTARLFVPLEPRPGAKPVALANHLLSLLWDFRDEQRLVYLAPLDEAGDPRNALAVWSNGHPLAVFATIVLAKNPLEELAGYFPLTARAPEAAPHG